MKKSYLKYLIIILFLILFLNFVNDKLMLEIDSPIHLTRAWHLKESLKKGHYPTLYPYMALSTQDYKFYPPVSRIMLSSSFLILDGLSEFYIMKYMSLFMILFQALSFYFLAKVLFKDEVKAVLASILLLIMPSNWLLLTLYGRVGATYAMPFIFLFLGFYLKYLEKPDKKNFALSTIMLSLSFLTQPIVSSQFLMLAIIYSLFHFKKKGLKVFTPLIIGIGLCMFYFIPLLNMPIIFTLRFPIDIDKLAIFLPTINSSYPDYKGVYLSPLIFFGGIAGAALILKKKLKKFNPLLIWYAYTLLLTLTPELFTIIAERISWWVYTQVFGIASCMIFPALITKKKNMNYLIYGLVGLFTILNGIYFINYNGLSSPYYMKADDISQFIPEYSYDNNLLTLPTIPNHEYIPFYSKINNAYRGFSWEVINIKYLTLFSALYSPELTLDEFYLLLKDLNVHILVLEKTVYTYTKGIVREYLKNLTDNYLMVFDELLEEKPDEFTVLYDDENRIILRTEWNNSFVTGGSYEVIRPESIRITPQNNTMLVKLVYLNNWQVSDGVVKESNQGMMIIDTNSTEPIMLEFLPTAYDYIGIILSLIALYWFLIKIKKFK